MKHIVNEEWRYAANGIGLSGEMWRMGAFAATAIEASSLPFPGATFVLIYGYLMDVSTWQLVAISALNSLVYVVFSLIPYYIGKYLGNLTQKKFDEKKVKKPRNGSKSTESGASPCHVPPDLGIISLIYPASAIFPSGGSGF